MSNQRIEMPHPAHFCGARSCNFRRSTYTNGYIVSTVGEYIPISRIYHNEKATYEQIGSERLYETMVFKAIPSKEKCCPYEIDVSQEVDFFGYNDPAEANEGHEKLVDKWSQITTPTTNESEE